MSTVLSDKWLEEPFLIIRGTRSLKNVIKTGLSYLAVVWDELVFYRGKPHLMADYDRLIQEQLELIETGVFKDIDRHRAMWRLSGFLLMLDSMAESETDLCFRVNVHDYFRNYLEFFASEIPQNLSTDEKIKAMLCLLIKTHHSWVREEVL